MDGSIPETLARPDEIDQAAPARPIDYHRLIANFRRRLPLILSVGGLVLAAVVIYTFLQTPRYTGIADVMINTQKEKVVNSDQVMSSLPTDTSTIDTEALVLDSRSLAEKVTNEQKLDQDPEFNPRLGPPSLLQTILHFGRAAAPVAPAPNSILAQREHEAIVDRVRSHLKVERTGLTYLLEVSFVSTDPIKAARLANAFADRYLLEQLDAKFDATQQANTWLSGKLDGLRQQVIDAETAAQQYRIANNLMSAQGATLTEQEISTLDQQVATARAAEAEQAARLNTAKAQLEHGSTGEDVGEALNSPVVQALRAQRASISQQVADLEGRYGERHPALLKAKRQLADLDDQIHQEIERIISNLDAQLEVARQRTASIVASAAQSKGTLATNNRASVKLNELDRNADAARVLYESFLNRFKETSSSQGLEQSDARIISRAKIPTSPSFPKKGLNFIIGIVLAAVSGLVAAAIAEVLDSGLATAEAVERYLDLPCLGSIPTLASTLNAQKEGAGLTAMSPLTYVVDKPLSSFSESFRNLRAAILFARVGEQAKVVAVTSSLPGEGKTTTSVDLARTMAIAGANVVIVDCDLRQRGVNRILASEPQIGLIEVLNGTATLEQALVRDELSGAMILPLSKSAHTPRDVFGTNAMRRLLEELRRRFDTTILDTAPVLPIADTRVLAPLADVVVLLARWRKTPRLAVDSSLRLLKSVNAPVVGVVLTQVDLKAQARHGYGDAGYYYEAYKKYYTS